MAITLSGDSPNLTSASLTTPTLTSPTFAGTPSGSIITSGTAVASTSGTSIDFTSIPSWVKRVTVMFRGVSTSGTSNYIVQIGAGSVDTSGYLTESWLSNTNNANYTNGFNVRISPSAATTLTGHLILTSFGSNVWIASGVVGSTSAAETGNLIGERALSGTLDRVRITTTGGTDTFDAGSINILYE